MWCRERQRMIGRWAEAAEPWHDRARLGYEAYRSTPNMVIVVDDHRRIGAINPAGEALTGLAYEDVAGEHLSVLLAPPTADSCLAEIERAASGDVAEVDVTFVAPCGDGREATGGVVVGIGAAPLFLDGEPAGLVLSGRDIEARHRLEHELDELASSFRTLAEASEIGIYRFGFDPELRVEHVNRAFAEAVGIDEGDLRRAPGTLADRLAPHVRQRFIDNRFGSGPPIWPIEFEWVRDDGEVVVLSVEEVPIRDRDGRVFAVLGLGRDVTQDRRREASIIRALQHERQAAEGLRSVDQLRRLFLQAVSHELRTPLTTVLGFASTLSSYAGELEPAQLVLLSRRVLHQARRMERLLDDLLDVERLSRGVLTLQREEHDVAEVVSDVLDDLDVGDVEVVVTPARIAIDRGKFERVIVNLVSNARRHAGRDARIVLEVVSTGDAIHLTVEDDGPGIPDELKDQVFEPFTQGPSTQRYASPGTGIGLTLVAEFVRLHGGSVRVVDGRDGGARFEIVLPKGLDGDTR
jgi:PAS domain S-box-containing protein